MARGVVPITEVVLFSVHSDKVSMLMAKLAM